MFLSLILLFYIQNKIEKEYFSSTKDSNSKTNEQSKVPQMPKCGTYSKSWNYTE
jgi:hypothetical protein